MKINSKPLRSAPVPGAATTASKDGPANMNIFLNPSPEVGDHARPGRGWPRRAASSLRATLTRTFGTFSSARGFPRGRGKPRPWRARSLSTSEFGLHPHAAAPGRGRAPMRTFQHARGFLEVDLVVGLAILTLAVLPLGFAFAHERQALRMEYCRSVANEIVDGEMEILAASAAKNLPDGTQNYSVHANALSQLPPGHFQLTKDGGRLRLEWQPDRKHRGGPVAREITLK